VKSVRAARVELARRKKDARKAHKADFQRCRREANVTERSLPKTPTDSDNDSDASSGSWPSPLHVQVFSSLRAVKVTGESSNFGGATLIKRSWEELGPNMGPGESTHVSLV
jgi:hypothetical protein